jgi:PAS domain S-box-containing protein
LGLGCTVAIGETGNNDLPNTYDTLYILSLYDSAYSVSESYDEAMVYISKASRISKNLDYKRGIALSYFYKGTIELNNDKQEDAIRSFETALDKFYELKQYNDVAATYRSIGNSYYFLSDYNMALKYSKRGLEISDSIGNKLESARLKAQMGSCYEDIGQYEKSLKLLLAANSDFKQLNNLEGIAETLNSLGVIYSTLDQFEKANGYFHKALKIYDKKNDNYGISNCLTNIGYMCFYNKNPDSALRYFLKSMQIDSLRNDQYGICLCLANIGEVYLSNSDYDRAGNNFLRSLEIAEEIDNTTMQCGINYQLANLNKELKDYPKAFVFAKKSLSLARQTGNPEDIINACTILDELYTQDGDYNKAHECLSEILNLNDSIFSLTKNQEIFRIESKYEEEKHEMEILALENKNEQQAKIKKVMLYGLVLGSFLLLALTFIALFIRRSKNRLKSQKKYFETLITNTEDYIIVLDDQIKIKYISPSYEQNIGRKVSNRIDKSPFEFILPEDTLNLKKAMGQLLSTAKPLSFEFRSRNASGELRYMSAYAKNMLDDPDIKGLVINVWDITNRKHYEKLILEKQKELEQSQKLAKLGSWKIDITTGMITLSKEVMLLLGEEEKETKLIFDDFVTKYFVKEDIPIVKSRLTKAIESIEKDFFFKEQLEARVKRKNPDKVIHIELKAEFAKDGVIHGVIQDITEKREAEKLILEKQKELEKSQRLAKIGSWKLNINTGIFTASAELMSLKGERHEELTMPFEEYAAKYFFEEDLPMFHEKIKLAIEQHGNISYKARFEGRVKTINPSGVNQIVMWGEIVEPGIVHGVTQDITQKKEAEKKLYESELKYRKIFNAFQDVYYKISIDGNVLEVSPSVKSIFGYSQEEIIGKSSGLFYDMDAHLEKIQNELIKNQEIQDIDVSLKTKEGKTIYCSLSAKLTIDVTTQLPTGIEGVLRDISDRRKAEMELEQSEKKFREIFNAFPDIFFLAGPEGVILEISPSVSAITGYSPKEIIGVGSHKFYARNEWDRIGAELGTNTMLNDFNTKLATKNNRVIDCSLNIKVIFGEENDIAGFVGVIRDISERRKMELALKESERKFRSIFNAFIDVYYRLSMEGVILEITPSIEYIGFTREELIGTHIENLYPKDLDQNLLYKKLDTERQVTDYDIVMLTKDKRKINCAVTARVLFDEEGKPLMIEGVVRDISERVETHRILKKSEKDLKKSNETKEKILSIIGHDLLGPIGTNKGITDLIVNEAERLSKEKIIELITSLKPAIDSTYTMVENLLSWARIQRKSIEHNPRPSYIKPLIDECFSLYNVQAKSKAIELVFKGSDSLSAFYDEHQMSIVIRNLVSNALKFTKSGGQVIIMLKENNEMAEISVSDTGIGIPENLLTGLFEDSANKISRYGTDNEKGTGLGLVIVKEFVKVNKGTIKVESKEGKGTTFTFTLPLVTY